MTKKEMKGPERSEQATASAARPQGALALVGAWRELSEKELDSLIEDIYTSREKDLGRRVELDA